MHMPGNTRGSTFFFNSGGELFVQIKNGRVYRLLAEGERGAGPGEAWEEQAGAVVRMERWGMQNFGYNLPYHRLLD